MKPERLENLLELARLSRPARSEEAPPFFAHRVVARWLSAAKDEAPSLWEKFALRGAALSAIAVMVALALNAAVWSGANDEGDLDYTADIFLLP